MQDWLAHTVMKISNGSHYNTIVIGSSPLMLINSIAASLQGNSVLIADERESLGGAWKTGEMSEWNQVEIGCHYIENDPRAYKFLEDVFRVHLSEMKPQPFIYLGRYQCSIDFFGVLMGFSKVGNAILHCQWDKALSNLKKLKSESVSLIRKYCRGRINYSYPTGGCGVIVDRLLKLIPQDLITIAPGCKILELHFNSHQQNLCVTSSGIFSFDKIVINSSTDLDTIQVNGQSVKINKTFKQVLHMNLDIVGDVIKEFSYIDLLHNGVIERISNVGIYSELFHKMRSQNRHLICVRTVDTDTNNVSVIANNAFNQLIQLGIIRDNSRLLNWRYDTHHYAELSEDELVRITELESSIEVLNSRDLGISLSRYINQWIALDSKDH